MPQSVTPQHYNTHLILIRRERLRLTGCFSSHLISKQADSQFWIMSLEESSVLLSGLALFTGTFLFSSGETVTHRYWSYPELKPKLSYLILFQTHNSDQDWQKGLFSLYTIQRGFERMLTDFSVCPWCGWVLYSFIQNPEFTGSLWRGVFLIFYLFVLPKACVMPGRYTCTHFLLQR